MNYRCIRFYCSRYVRLVLTTTYKHPLPSTYYILLGITTSTTTADSCLLLLSLCIGMTLAAHQPTLLQPALLTPRPCRASTGPHVRAMLPKGRPGLSGSMTKPLWDRTCSQTLDSTRRRTRRRVLSNAICMCVCTYQSTDEVCV